VSTIEHLAYHTEIEFCNAELECKKYQIKSKLSPEESKEKFSEMTTKSERFGDEGRSSFICEDSSLTFSSVSAQLLPGFNVPYMQHTFQ